jgi:hypothetical protein
MSKPGRGSSATKRIDQLKADIQKLDAQIKAQLEVTSRRERDLALQEQSARDALNLKNKAEQDLSRAKEDIQAAERDHQIEFRLEETRMSQQLKDVENETLRFKAIALDATSELARIETESGLHLKDARETREREEEQWHARRAELEQLELDEFRLLALIEMATPAAPAEQYIAQLRLTEQRLQNELAQLRGGKGGHRE